jgi:hypothetical protein
METPDGEVVDEEETEHVGPDKRVKALLGGPKKAHAKSLIIHF